MESRLTVRQDVDIIENSLHFVNDLFRNMLDMHHAASKQMKMNMVPTDNLHDVLEPVESILHQRHGEVKVTVECPQNLVAIADRLRLKQIRLNLGRNSCKFVQKGFIRLRAEVVENSVRRVVEDSGPGVPEEKQDLLFAKFQEIFDRLSQGTGVGLFLCKKLIELMGGEISLDNDYVSGVPGCRGTRIVVDLRTDPIDSNQLRELDASVNDVESVETAGLTLSEDGDSFRSEAKLPENLSVLFVDDDAILRKLFLRTVRRVAPKWDIREASNGETALRLVDSHSFDQIFMDMYMASVQKQLLGTEAVKALRAKGVTCRICGLSANDKAKEFLDAGPTHSLLSRSRARLETKQTRFAGHCMRSWTVPPTETEW
jgi:CheY-like chemotaxis protein